MPTSRARRPRVVDADGKLVTPGFVDIHTHYDGQATWDDVLDPSAGHGVTTVVAGNCGVGLRPRPPRPGAVADPAHGGRGGHPRHGPGRGHDLELGDLPRVPRRARRPELRHRHRHPGPPRRRAGLRDGRAGSQERAGHARGHRRDGGHRQGGHRGRRRSASPPRAPWPTGPWTASPCPAPTPPRTSCSASAGRWARSAAGVFELAPAAIDGMDAADPFKEIDWMRRLGAEIQRPVSFALLQLDPAPDLWRQLMDLSLEAIDGGREPAPAGRLPALRPAHRAADQPRLRQAPDLHGPGPPAPRRARRWP